MAMQMVYAGHGALFLMMLYAVSDKWMRTFSKSKLGLSGSVTTPKTTTMLMVSIKD